MGLKYKIAFEPERTTVQLIGSIDEHIGEILKEIRPQVPTKKLVFDCEKLALINSIGVATWLAHIAAFGDLELHFVNCPYQFTSLCLIIPDLTASGTVESLYVRFFCEECDGDHQNVLATRDETLKLGTFKLVPCPKCRNIMRLELDDEDFIQVFQGAA